MQWLAVVCSNYPSNGTRNKLLRSVEISNVTLRVVVKFGVESQNRSKIWIPACCHKHILENGTVRNERHHNFL